MDYIGKWRITEMEMWESDYLDMEVKAYITIESKDSGEFQFGLVSGQIDGEISKDGNRFEFTWDGNDECDPAFGSGWLILKDKDSLEGRIKFHQGDSSDLLATRMSN